MYRLNVHHGPHTQYGSARCRGSVYLFVLAVAVNILVFGITGIYLARVRLRTVQNENALGEARVLAQAGVEQAVSLMNNYTGGTGNWRADLLNDQETTPITLGQGTMSFKLVDPDGDLADDPKDSVWIYGIGRTGDAVWVERAQARIDGGRPLECLRTAIHSAGQLYITPGCTCEVVDAPVSTDGELYLQGRINGDAEAVSTSGTGNITGTLTTPCEPKGIPDKSIFDDYIARATQLPYNGDLDEMVLTPGLNEYGGGLNPDGVYYIDTNDNGITIQYTRLHGTLIIDTGSNLVTIQGSCLLEPFCEDYPVLMIRGQLRSERSNTNLSELARIHNFNPAGAPYQGRTDSDTSDSYPSLVRGLVYITGKTEIDNTGIYQGVIVSGKELTLSNLPVFIHDPNLMFDPPIGYTEDPNSTRMIITRGTWSREPASL